MIRSSAEEAIDAIRPDDIVIVGHAEPQALIRELCRQADRLRGLRLIVWPLTSPPRYLDADLVRRFRISALAGTHGFSRWIASGSVEYLPAHVSSLLHRRLGDLAPTVSLLHVASERSADGTYSLGIMADYSGAYVGDGMRLVIAEANRQMPAMPGPNGVSESHIDFLVDSDEPLELGKDLDAAPTHEMQQIAGHAAALVRDGATIEIGATALGNAIVRGLAGKTDLGFHSGVLGPAVLELMDRGVITNARKPLNRGVSVAATVHGSAAFNRTVAQRRDVEIWPNSYTHDPAIIAQLPDFVAFNSCLQVNLYGTVYSESVGGRILGTTGGQGDFMRGASYSKGGLSVIAMPATTKDRKRSRIVSDPAPGDLPTLPHTDVDVVVTEYGVADLRGKSLRERARALARIAAPEFRPALEDRIT